MEENIITYQIYKTPVLYFSLLIAVGSFFLKISILTVSIAIVLFLIFGYFDFVQYANSLYIDRKSFIVKRWLAFNRRKVKIPLDSVLSMEVNKNKSEKKRNIKRIYNIVFTLKNNSESIYYFLYVGENEKENLIKKVGKAFPIYINNEVVN